MSKMTSRRQLHSIKEYKKDTNDKTIFIEQKNRLKKHLNSIPIVYIEHNDLLNKSLKIKTRKQNKKQKKINSLLENIYLDKNNQNPLKEDTNLRLLKNISLNKNRYNDNNKIDKHISRSCKSNDEFMKYKSNENHLLDLFINENYNNKKLDFGRIPVINENLKENKEKKTKNNFNNEKTQDIELMNTKIDYLEQKLEKLSKKNNKIEDILINKNQKKINNPQSDNQTIYDILKEDKDKKIKINNKRSNKQKTNYKYLNISIIILGIIFLILLFLIFILLMYYKNLKTGVLN